ncbi:hypothetical protein ABZV14_07060 [Streptosporangium canum]|uniref:hypothetical protein n=1 Tax=Streptosporangium canum TaxID=324952 RepID=UPI0033BB3A02
MLSAQPADPPYRPGTENKEGVVDGLVVDRWKLADLREILRRQLSLIRLANSRAVRYRQNLRTCHGQAARRAAGLAGGKSVQSWPMGLLLLLLLFVVPAGPGLWFWYRSLAGGRWRHSAGWFAGTAVLLVLGTGVTYLAGSLAGGNLDPEEACHADGQTYDRAYRRANFDEYTQWFPLHDRCHAGYDLVPAWVNPALVVLPVLAAACLAYAVRLAVIRRRAKQGTP